LGVLDAVSLRLGVRLRIHASLQATVFNRNDVILLAGTLRNGRLDLKECDRAEQPRNVFHGYDSPTQQVAYNLVDNKSILDSGEPATVQINSPAVPLDRHCHLQVTVKSRALRSYSCPKCNLKVT
jgi:hypothetical protein